MSKRCCLIAAVTLVAALNGRATDSSWIADAAGNWGDAIKWTAGIPAAGDVVNLTLDISASGSFNGTTLTLSWPAGAGWVLQWQTNGLNQGLGTNWVDVPGSDSINSTNITVDKLMPTVFYRPEQ